MTTGDKLARLRKENNYTQEQLAELLGVSRQAVSKWESDLAFPETEKLIRISELYGCSVDYLLKDEPAAAPEIAEPKREEENPSLFTLRIRLPKEMISKTTVWGMPLYHVGRNARGFFAVGLKAQGVFSVGLLSMGVVSFGLVSLGLLAMGVLAVGLVALGSFAVGILSAGAICMGVFAMGAIAVGEMSAGALAIGKYAAIGDYARAMIALGKNEAHGTLFRKLGSLTAAETEQVRELLDNCVPGWLGWAKNLFALFLG